MIANHQYGCVILILTEHDDQQHLIDIFQYWNNRYTPPDDFRPVSQDIINYLKEYV